VSVTATVHQSVANQAHVTLEYTSLSGSSSNDDYLGYFKNSD